MAERNVGQELIEALNASDPTVMDPFLINSLIIRENGGEDIGSVSVSMLVQVEEDSEVDLSKYALVRSNIGAIFALRATPVQIIELLKLPEVICIEASSPFMQE